MRRGTGQGSSPDKTGQVARAQLFIAGPKLTIRVGVFILVCTLHCNFPTASTDAPIFLFSGKQDDKGSLAPRTPWVEPISSGLGSGGRTSPHPHATATPTSPGTMRTGHVGNDHKMWNHMAARISQEVVGTPCCGHPGGQAREGATPSPSWATGLSAFQHKESHLTHSPALDTQRSQHSPRWQGLPRGVSTYLPWAPQEQGTWCTLNELAGAGPASGLRATLIPLHCPGTGLGRPLLLPLRHTGHLHGCQLSAGRWVPGPPQ